jgi:molybdopterin molybdotransferase
VTGVSVDSAVALPVARDRAASAGAQLDDERVALEGAVGRVLAHDVRALTDVPHYVSSAMDGWAVRGAGPWALVEGSALALDTAVAVVTGGLVPTGAEAVLRSENGRIDGRTLFGDPAPFRAQHLRPIAKEARRNDVVIRSGTVLNPAHIAVAAVCGHDELAVVRVPRIAMLLTGDEVVERGIPLPGRVRDSFGPQLPSLLALLGGAVSSHNRVPDDLDSTIAALRAAASDSDLIVTTGGTGGSPVDHVRPALRELGATLIVERLALRPGGPSLLARLPDGRFVVALPGNPLAAMMGLLVLAAPLITTLAGRPLAEMSRVTVAESFEGRPGTSILVPYRLEGREAVANLWRDAGMMRGLAEADGVLIVPPAGLAVGHDAETLQLPWT